MKSRPSAFVVLGIAFAFGTTSSAAADESCSLALVLAMDASKSMDSTDFDLAFHGTAAALRSAAVQEAIFAQSAPVALVAFEWSGENHQRMVHDWSMLETHEDIEEFAGSLESHERGGRGQMTATGSALAFSYALLENGPDCTRKVVDVSSDGYSSEGITPADFYARVPATEVTVNALVIGGEARPHLWAYFNGEVLHGPGSFSLATNDFQDFPEAMKEKLLLELAFPHVSAASELPFAVR